MFLFKNAYARKHTTYFLNCGKNKSTCMYKVIKIRIKIWLFLNVILKKPLIFLS